MNDAAFFPRYETLLLTRLEERRARMRDALAAFFDRAQALPRGALPLLVIEALPAEQIPFAYHARAVDETMVDLKEPDAVARLNDAIAGLWPLMSQAEEDAFLVYEVTPAGEEMLAVHQPLDDYEARVAEIARDWIAGVVREARGPRALPVIVGVHDLLPGQRV